jgi:hypothetical protein
MNIARTERIIYLSCYAKELSRWSYLTDGERDAAIVLGWNDDIWNRGLCPLRGMTLWHKLDNEERQSAEILGYNQTTWNTDVMREYFVE